MTPKKYYKIISGIILALVIIGSIGYWYALTLLGDASQKLAAQMGVESSADDRISNLVSTKNTYDKQIAPILPQINEALPNTANQTEILAQLKEVARVSGASLSTVTFTTAPATGSGIGGGVVTLPMSFQVSGTYTQAQTFLADVENLSRLTTVDSLTVSRSGQTITYAINLSAYSKP